jgi:hypothetical protein
MIASMLHLKQLFVLRQLQFSYLFYDALSTSEYTASNVTTIHERRIRKGLEQSARCQVEITSGLNVLLTVRHRISV